MKPKACITILVFIHTTIALRRKPSACRARDTAIDQAACIRQNAQISRRYTMDQYVCEPCGYVYDPQVGDPDNGIAPGTAFQDIPEDWVCPVCGLGKDVFVKV